MPQGRNTVNGCNLVATIRTWIVRAGQIRGANTAAVFKGPGHGVQTFFAWLQIFFRYGTANRAEERHRNTYNRRERLNPSAHPAIRPVDSTHPRESDHPCSKFGAGRESNRLVRIEKGRRNGKMILESPEPTRTDRFLL